MEEGGRIPMRCKSVRMGAVGPSVSHLLLGEAQRNAVQQGDGALVGAQVEQARVQVHVPGGLQAPTDGSK